MKKEKQSAYCGKDDVQSTSYRGNKVYKHFFSAKMTMIRSGIRNRGGIRREKQNQNWRLYDPKDTKPLHDGVQTLGCVLPEGGVSAAGRPHVTDPEIHTAAWPPVEKTDTTNLWTHCEDDTFVFHCLTVFVFNGFVFTSWFLPKEFLLVRQLGSENTFILLWTHRSDTSWLHTISRLHTGLTGWYVHIRHKNKRFVSVVPCALQPTITRRLSCRLLPPCEAAGRPESPLACSGAACRWPVMSLLHTNTHTQNIHWQKKKKKHDFWI